MSDPLDDLLGSLNQGPVPPLAPAALVRGRGDQRRRRTRIVGSLAGLVLVGAVSGTALVLTGAGGHEALSYATPSPSAPVQESPQLTPSPVAQPSLTPGAPPPGPGVPGYRLIRPLDAGTAAGGQWTVVGPKTDSPAGALDCQGRYGTAGSTGELRNAAGTVVSTQVVDYDVSADTRLREIARDASRCGDGATLSYKVLSGPLDRVAVIQRSGGPAPLLFVVVASFDKSIAIVTLPPSEADHTTNWVAAAQHRMGCVEQTCTVGADGCDDLCQGLVHPAAGWPAQAADGTYGVYLKVARDPLTSTAIGDLSKAVNQARDVGYIAYDEPLGCDEGVVGALNLDPTQSYSGARIFFASEALARDFVARYRPGVVGIAHVTKPCVP